MNSYDFLLATFRDGGLTGGLGGPELGFRLSCTTGPCFTG